MPVEPLLLGLDIGTSRIKAQLLDRRGAEAAFAAVPTPFAGDGGRAEMAVDDLRGAVARALADLGPAALAAVAGVGIAGMAESGAPLDRAGEPLAPVIGWHDPRGADVVVRLKERFGDDLDHRIGQRLRAVSSVAKLGWLVDHGLGRRGAGPGPGPGPGGGSLHRWLGVPELCLHGLTGVESTEGSLAVRTGAYDVGGCRWMPGVLHALGLPDGVFAPVATAGTAIGTVTPAGTAWSGLPPGIPVTLAGHDHLAGVEGAGTEPGDLVNSVGTAETVVARHPTLPDVDRAIALGAAVTLRPGGEGWVALVSAARAGLVVGPVAQALGRSPAELDRLAEEAGAAAVDVGDAVARIQAGAPVELPGGPPGEVWNGVLAALAARTWDAAGRLVDLLGPAGRLVVFGGGSTSRAWLRAKARAGCLPVWRSTVHEAVARGAGLFAGVAAGWWPSTDEAPRVALEEVAGAGSSPG